MSRAGRSMTTTVLGLIALAAISTVLAACGGSDDSAAPAFSSTELASAPKRDWITNGGSISNDRYSPLSEIDTSNVGRLKGLWHVHLKSGTTSKYSGEAQPLVYDGVIYTITGADDVFAVDARTGKTKWAYRANLDQKISTVCCGWTSRGVAIGDGKVYVGQLDGKLVALDQSTGKVAWSTQVARWQDGYTITSAPLYYDGRVYTGVSGGEYLIRGRVTAFDAKSGKELWRFYTIPGRGEVGHDTWPATGDAWTRGGAPVWQTPAVDPNLGLLYVSTGNAAPDADGRARAGDNLFASSIVAIDAKTGTYKWHFQEVHHDVWDYDATSPVVLFDVNVGGKVRHGIAEPCKTGWLYLLDRTNGKPLFGIPERPVPQDPVQHTAKTQPFPSNAPFSPHTVSAQQLKEIQALVDATAPKGKAPKVVAAPIFTPPAGAGTTIPAVAPGPQGGTNWPPTSYNPKTQLFYVCGQAGASSYTYGENPPKSEKQGTLDFGSIPTATGFGKNAGTFTAIAADGGRIAWQQKWADSCYSGSATTGGNLVFVGRNTGELQAYDAPSGDRLWSFQTGAGANAPATVFELDGKEVIAFYAAGSSLAGSAHGDDLWLFGLDGTLGPVAPGKTSGAGEHAGESTATGTTIQVQGGEFFFKLSANTLPKPEKVTFVFKNTGSIQHDFSINGKTTPIIGPGKTAKLTVTFTKAGTYPYVCTVTGHAAAGMKGVFTVR
jgi:quinohemoprotein ethanol dehydrogenase